MCWGRVEKNQFWLDLWVLSHLLHIFVIRLACKTPEDSDDKRRPGVKCNLQDIPRYQEGRKVLALGVIFLQYLRAAIPIDKCP